MLHLTEKQDYATLKVIHKIKLNKNMEYTEPKTYTKSENLNEPKCKTLEQLISLLEMEVSKLNAFSLTINEKLQNINSYTEPNVSNVKLRQKDEPISFTENLEQEINELNYYNDRLSFSVRHLDTLI